MLGPRLDKYDKNGNPCVICGHNIVLQSLGLWILFFGWFAFNAGSAGLANAVIPQVCVNTVFSAVLGGLCPLVFHRLIYGSYDLTIVFNGILAGLVSVTGGCAYLDVLSACITGAIGGVLMWTSWLFLENRLMVDDPVGAFPVHGVSGAWGLIAIGLFHRESGLLYSGNWSQLWVQTIGMLAIGVPLTIFAYCLLVDFSKPTPSGRRHDRDKNPIWICSHFCFFNRPQVWAFVLQVVIHATISLVMHTRVSEEVERTGLDSELAGGAAYMLQVKPTNRRHAVLDVLARPSTMAIFQRFLESKASGETLNLYRAITRYERAKTYTEAEVLQLIKTYISPKARNPTNLPAWVSDTIMLNRNHPTPNIFLDAKEECLEMMKIMYDHHFVGSEYFSLYKSELEAIRGHPPLWYLRFGPCCKTRGSLKKGGGIDKELEEMHVREQLSFKVLLLGAGEVGKSTLFKQIGRLRDVEQDSRLILSTIDGIRTNACDTIKKLIQQARLMGLEPKDDILMEICEIGDPRNYTLELGNAILTMWRTPEIQTVFAQRSDSSGFHLLGNAVYYMENAVRFCDSNDTPYAPTRQDFLRVRIKTTSISELSFQTSSAGFMAKVGMSSKLANKAAPFNWTLIDVGGQR